MIFLLILSNWLFVSCRSPRYEFDDQIALVANGNRTIEGKMAAVAFAVPPSCTATTFDRAIVHDDALGCLTCVSFDVKPLDGCRYTATAIYLNLNRASRQSAVAAMQRYINATLPRDARVDTVQTLPTSSQKSTIDRIVYRGGSKTYEVKLQVTQHERLSEASGNILSIEYNIFRVR